MLRPFIVKVFVLCYFLLRFNPSNNLSVSTYEDVVVVDLSIDNWTNTDCLIFCII